MVPTGVRRPERGLTAPFPVYPGTLTRVGNQHLQRHVPVELGVSRSIHFTHAPLANEGGDIVVAESGADC